MLELLKNNILKVSADSICDVSTVRITWHKGKSEKMVLTTNTVMTFQNVFKIWLRYINQTFNSFKLQSARVI